MEFDASRVYTALNADELPLLHPAVKNTILKSKAENE